MPTPWVRFSQISFFVSSFSYSSIFAGNMSRNAVHRLVEAGRQILAQAADADVAREHPEAGDHLVDVEDAARGR